MTTETLNVPADAVATPAAAPATPRLPKLTVIIDGKEQTLLRYPFPVKAAKFPIKVNGNVVDAACTAGKGRAYTYFLVNNTSFYTAGTLPVDAEVTVNFPADYKFDEAQAVRVSDYKPKKAKKEAAPGEAVAAASAASGDGSAATTAESTARPDPRADATAGAEKAKRRGK